MVISAYLHEHGIDATARQLRHWFGTEVYAAGHDIRVTQELLGHSDPSTTAGYIAYSHVDAGGGQVADDLGAVRGGRFGLKAADKEGLTAAIRGRCPTSGAASSPLPDRQAARQGHPPDPAKD